MSQNGGYLRFAVFSFVAVLILTLFVYRVSGWSAVRSSGPMLLVLITILGFLWTVLPPILYIGFKPTIHYLARIDESFEENGGTRYNGFFQFNSEIGKVRITRFSILATDSKPIKHPRSSIEPRVVFTNRITPISKVTEANGSTMEKSRIQVRGEYDLPPYIEISNDKEELPFDMPISFWSEQAMDNLTIRVTIEGTGDPFALGPFQALWPNPSFQYVRTLEFDVKNRTPIEGTIK